MGLRAEYARKLMEGYTKEDYLGFLVHEFSTTPFLTLDERLSLIKAVEKLGGLPADFTSYRLRCLKGKDPGPPSRGVFSPPLLSFASRWFPIGGGLGVDWGCIRMMPARGMTAEEEARRLEKDFSEKEADLRDATIPELKGFADAKDEMAEEYVKSGWDRLYPEYAPIIEWYREEARRLRTMRTQKIAKQRGKAA